MDINVAENLRLKYMYYNTYRPSVPSGKTVRIPFFGNCQIHKIKKERGGEFRITVRVELAKAKDAVIHIAQHLALLDRNSTASL